MTAYFEVWKPSGVELVPLTGDRVTIGRGGDNDIALTEDRMVSSHHALLEPVAEGWCIQDLGSRNGSLVAGQPLSGIKVLRR